MNSGAEDATCPVMHGGMTSSKPDNRSNQQWWPNNLNLKILHQRLQVQPPRARLGLQEGIRGA